MYQHGGFQVISDALLTDQIRILGPDHPHTLNTRDTRNTRNTRNNHRQFRE